MKRKIWIVMLMACFLGILSAGHGNTAKAGSLSTRGVWISCFEYEELGLQDKEEATFRTNVNRLFKQVKSNGCNTVYFHVRSYDDAIYPSKIVGWSKKMTTTGKALSYDPLAILVSSAHRYGLSFHAWLNPYRKTPEKILDPGLDSTRERIVSQVKEIIDNYNVDGIHFDDYFYPKNDKKYNKVSKTQKMNTVNTMLKEVHDVVAAKKLKFGISPAGDISYCEAIGADVKTWMSVPGYVDYIVPQIYWSDCYYLNGKKTKLFQERLKKWRSLNQLDVPMYIGLALYKAGESLTLDLGWSKRSDNIRSQLKMIKSGNTEGYVLFAFTNLYRSSTWKEVKNYLSEVGTLKISKKKVTLKTGKSYRLKTSVSLTRMKGKVQYRSSNRRIAVVTKSGKIKAKRKGKVKIYATFGKITKVCRVTIKKKK